MSLQIEGKKCPVCKGYLFAEDEIVWCPECGAPHHKECYKANGKCGFSELHGTKQLEDALATPVQSEVKNEAEQQNEQQEQQPKINVRCTSCGATFPLEYDSCPNCSAENMAKKGHYFMFDMLGGVKPDEDLGSGVTATQAKNFVMVSTNRFIPKFAALKNAKRSFFSWFSFFFPTANFAGRKMYHTAVLSGLLEIAGALFMYPFSLALSQRELYSYKDIYAYVEAGVEQEIIPLMVIGFIGAVITIAYKLFCGFNFDKLYYKHTIKTIAEIEQQDETKEEKILSYRKKGGVSLMAFIISLFLVQYIPSIIAAFIL